MKRSDKGREWAVCTQKANCKTEQWRGQNRGRKHHRWKQEADNQQKESSKTKMR